MEFDANQIQEILPHRPPFLLVDRITGGEPGVWAQGIKCVTVNEPFFAGHFPGYHVMPGVLIMEALAQVGAVAILSLPENKGKLAFFGGIKNARFKRQVVPGDVLELRCELTRQVGSVGFGKAEARGERQAGGPGRIDLRCCTAGRSLIKWTPAEKTGEKRRGPSCWRRILMRCTPNSSCIFTGQCSGVSSGGRPR